MTIELVLDTVLPGDAELGMPSGSSIDFDGYRLKCRAHAQIDAFVELLARVALDKFGESFDALDADARLAAVNACRLADIRVFSAFVTHAMRAYYTDRNVLARIGAGAVPPFPAGNTLDADDWTLLEPVYERGPICRRTDGPAS